MKHYKKIITSILVFSLFSSLNVRSEIAPNLLELVEGTTIIGESFQSDEFVYWNMSVDRLWHDSFFDLDVIDFTWDVIHNPPYHPVSNVTREIITQLIVQENRTLLIPVTYYYVETTDYNLTIFFDISVDLNITDDDLKVIYDGTTYIYDEIDPGESFYNIVGFWLVSFAFGNAIYLEYMPFTPYAISPQVTIGQEILYGQYNGTVVGFTEYYISETEYFEAIEVYHDEVIITANILGSDQEWGIGNRTLFYEKNTGIVLHYLEYNSSTDTYYYYNTTDTIGISPIQVVPEFSIPLLAILSSMFIILPILLRKRKEK